MDHHTQLKFKIKVIFELFILKPCNVLPSSNCPPKQQVLDTLKCSSDILKVSFIPLDTIFCIEAGIHTLSPP